MNEDACSKRGGSFKHFDNGRIIQVATVHVGTNLHARHVELTHASLKFANR